MSDETTPEIYRTPVPPIEMTPPVALPQSSAAPGWYLDERSGLMRWWDGAGWTEHFGPQAPIAAMARPVMVVPLKQSGLAYLFLLLLGGVGAHHFYLNRVGSAVTMLILTVIGWATTVLFVGFFLLGAVFIWWIVDLCLIPSYVRDANARTVRGIS